MKQNGVFGVKGQMTDSFQFKQFTIFHDRCAMKVGTDGVLLGAWAHGGRRVLDVGAGTGLISLMMAQRFPEARIEGVEIDAAAARQAAENISASPFAGRVGVWPVALQDFEPSGPYEAIVSNPPFFLNGEKNPDAGRRMARHAENLPFAVLFRFAVRWLTPDGELSAIVPAEVVEQFVADAYLSGLCLSRRVDLRTTQRKPVRRCLVAFCRLHGETVERAVHTLLNPDGSRSDWYQELAKDFYIR